MTGAHWQSRQWLSLQVNADGNAPTSGQAASGRNLDLGWLNLRKIGLGGSQSSRARAVDVDLGSEAPQMPGPALPSSVALPGPDPPRR